MTAEFDNLRKGQWVAYWHEGFGWLTGELRPWNGLEPSWVAEHPRKRNDRVITRSMCERGEVTILAPPSLAVLPTGPTFLPTEPTWGIAVVQGANVFVEVGRCQLVDGVGFLVDGAHWPDVRDFIPLTDEQVARIEAAR